MIRNKMNIFTLLEIEIVSVLEYRFRFYMKNIFKMKNGTVEYCKKYDIIISMCGN